LGDEVKPRRRIRVSEGWADARIGSGSLSKELFGESGTPVETHVFNGCASVPEKRNVHER
jgi:hypothetical protein